MEKIEINKSYKYKDLLVEKEYLKILFGNVVTRFGDGIDTIVYAWLVLSITGSASLSAITFGVNGLPNIIFGLVSGVVASYYSKKKIIFICDVGRGVLSVLTAVLYITGNLEVWHLFLFTFLNSSFEAFRDPPATSIDAEIISKEKLNIALSLNSTLVQGSQFIGIIVAPLFISIWGLGGGILIDAATFIICAVVIITLKYNDTTIKEEKITIKSGINDFKEGFKFLKSNKLAVNICIFCAVVNALFVPLNALAPAYVQSVGLGAEGLTFVQAPLIVAMAIGGIFYPRVNCKISAKNLFIINGVLFGICAVVFSVLGDLNYINLCIIGISFVMGIAIIYINIPINVAIISKIDKEFLARINGLMRAINLSMTPIASFIIGIMVGFIEVKHMFFILGTGSIILFLLQIRNKILEGLN